MSRLQITFGGSLERCRHGTPACADCLTVHERARRNVETIQQRFDALPEKTLAPLIAALDRAAARRNRSDTENNS